MQYQQARAEGVPQITNSEMQRGTLPSIYQNFSGNEHFSLFAKMIPAKEVGGDFYDFFYLDDAKTKLACVIADVSGKGVPAALFTVNAKTLVKQYLLHFDDPARALEQASTMLCSDNPHNMFVTMFVCTIELMTGALVYVNAGHNPPLLSLGGRKYQFMKLNPGIPLGIFNTYHYTRGSLTLPAGGKLYLYTDGVNEAMNTDKEEFGNERFLQAANAAIDLSPDAFDENVRETLRVFTDGAEQSDDITTLALHYYG